VANQDLLGEVHAKVYLLWTGVVLELATHRQKAGVVASYYLVLDEPLLEGVGLFERLVFLF
jgi:hypothetical protein